jgi:hypothetical protein
MNGTVSAVLQICVPNLGLFEVQDGQTSYITADLCNYGRPLDISMLFLGLSFLRKWIMVVFIDVRYLDLISVLIMTAKKHVCLCLFTETAFIIHSCLHVYLFCNSEYQIGL